MGKYLLLDGFNLAFRAFHAMPELSRTDGFPTGALHGWIKTIWKVQDLEKPEVTAVYFDKDGAAARTELFADYKANRTEMPEPLSQQLEPIQELTRLLGVPQFSESGVEADDLIGSIAPRLAEAGHEAVIVSADKDLGQCLRPGVVQLMPAPTANPKLGWRRRDAADLEAKLGITPEQVPDYLALIGDTVDNIPGVPGVGPKTATKWLQAHGNLEGVLAAAAEIKPPRFRDILPEMTDTLRQNLQLVTLDTARPVETPAMLPVDAEALVQWLEQMEMKQAARQAADRHGLFRLE